MTNMVLETPLEAQPLLKLRETKAQRKVTNHMREGGTMREYQEKSDGSKIPNRSRRRE